MRTQLITLGVILFTLLPAVAVADETDHDQDAVLDLGIPQAWKVIPLPQATLGRGGDLYIVLNGLGTVATSPTDVVTNLGLSIWEETNGAAGLQRESHFRPDGSLHVSDSQHFVLS